MNTSDRSRVVQAAFWLTDAYAKLLAALIIARIQDQSRYAGVRAAQIIARIQDESRFLHFWDSR